MLITAEVLGLGLITSEVLGWGLINTEVLGDCSLLKCLGELMTAELLGD